MKTQVKESVIRVHSDLVGFYFREYKMRRLMKISLNKTVTHYGLNYQKKFEKSLSIFIKIIAFQQINDNSFCIFVSI